ncbi:ABC transporter permease subunit [Actinomycetospora cinnamomea]|uniref:ABC-2 type transport system permease protein n=1 Tax=Actinomycetospora cinnamomea TaxID=663609 RepID=A0A2U1FLA3_9PSEU|nr:ABC transporter permease subunit [Actinomycetospora cinnamomea]PVZ12939.1 ABC-2 type transport system permease protein [Actinomycetospora cinnamomea]
MTTVEAARTRAPLGRLAAAEVRWVLRRPRTLVLLALLASVPVAVGVGIALTGGPGGGDGDGPGLVAAVAGNGLVLPIAALGLALTLLLPLTVATAAADALAGEAQHGTLRGLLLAPVGRGRLVVMKAVGVVAVTVLAVLVVAVAGVITGLVVVGGPDGTLITLSGTALGLWEAMGRVALVAAWTIVQLLAVGAVALAISAFTEHPLVVLAAVLGGLIVFGVLAAVPSLEWLQPLLLTSGWGAGTDALRDPLPLDDLASSTARALVYLVVGVALTVWRMRHRDG